MSHMSTNTNTQETTRYLVTAAKAGSFYGDYPTLALAEKRAREIAPLTTLAYVYKCDGSTVSNRQGHTQTIVAMVG